MGVFNPAVVTTRGQALLAKTVAGACQMQFTKMALSDTMPKGSLATTVMLENIKQLEPITYLGVKDDTSVTCEVAFTNKDLKQGYHVRVIGVYAYDPDVGEILYCISVADETSVTADWMPPYENKGVTSLLIDVITTVANSKDVSIVVDPTAFATKGELQDMQELLNTHTHNPVGTLYPVGYREQIHNLNMVVAIRDGAEFTSNQSPTDCKFTGHGYFDIGVCHDVIPNTTSALTHADSVYVEIEGWGEDPYPQIYCIDRNEKVTKTVLFKDLSLEESKYYYFKWSGIVPAWLRVYLSAGTIAFTSFKISEIGKADGFLSSEDKTIYDNHVNTMYTNPHNVTAEQVGAYDRAYIDNTLGAIDTALEHIISVMEAYAPTASLAPDGEEIPISD